MARPEGMLEAQLGHSDGQLGPLLAGLHPAHPKSCHDLISQETIKQAALHLAPHEQVDVTEHQL